MSVSTSVGQGTVKCEGASPLSNPSEVPLTCEEVSEMPSFSKVPFSYLSTIPKKERYSKYEAAGSWYKDMFCNTPKSVSDYARIWHVKYDTAHLWVKDFCANTDMELPPKQLENQGVVTGKLLEKITQLEQQLTLLKSKPLENDWKIGGESLDTTIRESRKEKKEKPIKEKKEFTLTEKTLKYADMMGLDFIEIEYQLKKMIDNWEGRGKYPVKQSAFTAWIESKHFELMPAHVRSAREKFYAEKEWREMEQDNIEATRIYDEERAKDPEKERQHQERMKNLFPNGKKGIPQLPADFGELFKDIEVGK